ncbi:YLR281C-like protein [Saccharomyces cerevisiae x Saccharomyces kudriavzevii VIN7]|uniref:YLR281C-like protein n=1 Tax=Saccharomyces cerevisiae x Saccharomyces kudriavzevii (strain VIN7) TaxID=1095631 RepID=H0GYH7_SACCK|nr:YLR281C-like protein [Saccharomyces cerevisiae x Saccharomyces kudriavzevii VIN7]
MKSRYSGETIYRTRQHTVRFAGSVAGFCHQQTMIKAVCKRWVSGTAVPLIKKNKLPPRPQFTPEMEKQCTEKFLHGGRGPGGQKINKCNSKVQLRHEPTGTVVECQETRSREQNRKLARLKLARELAVSCDATPSRDEALLQWHRQQKRSQRRRSVAKYEQREEAAREEKEEREARNREMLRELFRR